MPTPIETGGFLKQLISFILTGLKVKVSCLKEAESLLFLLQILSEMIGTNSYLVENFGSVLLRLGHVMLGDHVQGAVNRAYKRRRSRSCLNTNSNNQNNSNSDIRTDLASREYFENSCFSSIQRNIDYDKNPKTVVDTELKNGNTTKENIKNSEDEISKNNNNNSSSNNSNNINNSNPLEELSGKILTCCLCILF